jgi:hypothetical protein
LSLIKVLVMSILVPYLFTAIVCVYVKLF